MSFFMLRPQEKHWPLNSPLPLFFYVPDFSHVFLPQDKNNPFAKPTVLMPGLCLYLLLVHHPICRGFVLQTNFACYIIFCQSLFPSALKIFYSSKQRKLKPLLHPPTDDQVLLMATFVLVISASALNKLLK